MEEFQVTVHSDVAKITLVSVPDKPGIAAQIFGTLWSHGLNVQLIVSSSSAKGKTNITFAIAGNDLNRSILELKSARESVGAESLDIKPDAALISISHPKLSLTPGIANRIFSALSGINVNVEAVSSTPTCITCLLSRKDLSRSAEILQKEFGLK